ncbi:MAG: hypothetical protein R2800_10040 [Flavipsychrobacter sp.]
MATKITNKKTTCNKIAINNVAPQNVTDIEIHIPSKVLAKVVGCSAIYVRKVRSGERNKNTSTAQKIEVAELLIKEEINMGIDKVKTALSTDSKPTSK